MFVKKFPQADRDVNLPDEGDMLSGIKPGREGPGHIGGPGGGEGCKLGAKEGGGDEATTTSVRNASD